MWHRKDDLCSLCNSTARKQFGGRMEDGMPILHSMAIDLTPCHDKPHHWLGVEVDSLWSHSKGDPCVHWVTHSQSEWNMVNGQLWQPATLRAQWVGWRQTGPVQCSRQLAGWYNSLSLEWICNRPSFRAHRCRCVCFVRHNHPLYTHMEAEQMESYWKFSSSSCLMLIRWHRWVDITKWVGGMQLLRHNLVWSYNTFNLSCEAITSGVSWPHREQQARSFHVIES